LVTFGEAREHQIPGKKVGVLGKVILGTDGQEIHEHSSSEEEAHHEPSALASIPLLGGYFETEKDVN
jgi:hypothetical protein